MFSREIDRINSRRTNVACLCNTALCWVIMKATTKIRNTQSMFFHRGSRYASRDRWALFYLLFSYTLVSLTQIKLKLSCCEQHWQRHQFYSAEAATASHFTPGRKAWKEVSDGTTTVDIFRTFLKICLRRSFSVLSATERWEPRNQDRSAEKENLSAFFIQVSGGATVAI